MILHVVTFAWQDAVTPEDVTALVADLEEFRAEMPMLLDYRYGADLGLRAGNGDFAIVATVVSPEALREYLDAPAHRELLEKRLGGMFRTRLAVQIAVDAPLLKDT